MRKMKYLKLFENYSKVFESTESELLDQLDDSYIEEYWDKHLAYTDVEDVYCNFPNMVWDYINDKIALADIKRGEIDNYGIDDFSNYDFKEYINGKDVDDEDEEEIFKKHIESEIDLDELKDLKIELKGETDIDERKRLRKEIKKIKKKIKEIRELLLSEVLDEMSEDDLREIITDVFDEEEFVESIIEDRFREYYSLENYIESVWGSIDSIEFNSSYSNKRGDWDWLLNYLDDKALLKDFNDNEEYDHKFDSLQNNISDTKEIQEKLLEVDSKNAIELFDLFDEDTTNNIGDDYEFQKAYVEAYAKNYADDESELPEGKGLALKNLYEKFGLQFDIEDEYEDYMHYVLADKYNI